MQYCIQILNQLTRMLLALLKKYVLKVWFPLASQKSNHPLNLFSTRSFISASVSATWIEDVQGKNGCKPQETFRDSASLWAVGLLFNLHFMYFILITCKSPAYFLRCGCWTSEWIEIFKNWRLRLFFVPHRPKSQRYQVKLTIEIEFSELWGCILPQFQNCPRQNPPRNNKELLPCNHSKNYYPVSIHPQKA